MAETTAGKKPEPTHEQIRDRAYDIWERRHRPEGYEAEFWLQAEHELRRERGLVSTRPTGGEPLSGSGSDCAH